MADPTVIEVINHTPVVELLVGIPGIDGVDGEDGIGKSAADVWREQGHVGNDADFLAWLVEQAFSTPQPPNIPLMEQVFAEQLPTSEPDAAFKLYLDGQFVKFSGGGGGGSGGYSSLTNRQMRTALASQNQLFLVLDQLPLGDPNDPVSIQWLSNARIIPGDAVWDAIQAILGYNDTAMNGLADLAANSDA